MKRLCLKVYVEKKIPANKLPKNQLIPERLDDLETDVEEIGKLEAQ